MAQSIEDFFTNRASAIRSVIAVAIGLIALLELAEELLARRRRAIRAATAWWSGVERRQQRENHKAEVGFLARLVSPL